jgi:hypothetical protein
MVRWNLSELRRRGMSVPGTNRTFSPERFYVRTLPDIILSVSQDLRERCNLLVRETRVDTSFH